MFESSISITADTSQPTSSDYAPINLIQNLENRSSSCTNAAVVSFPSTDPYVDLLDQKSCFLTDYQQISTSNYKAVIGLDFSEPVFMHAILYVGDHYFDDKSWNIDTTMLKNLF